ncbi:pyroglutamyl peptidase, partial [Streptomyces sp. SID1034]|nr:pyroglutamyl peptidase [Streptomyces sp. SID1034]
MGRRVRVAQLGCAVAAMTFCTLLGPAPAEAAAGPRGAAAGTRQATVEEQRLDRAAPQEILAR